MEYRYKIWYINERERWISIGSNDDSDTEEEDSFVYLVKWIQAETKGKIKEVGWMQYKIDGDGIGFIYQWDDLFGITIIYPFGKKNEALQYLKPYLSDF